MAEPDDRLPQRPPVADHLPLSTAVKSRHVPPFRQRGADDDLSRERIVNGGEREPFAFRTPAQVFEPRMGAVLRVLAVHIRWRSHHLARLPHVHAALALALHHRIVERRDHGDLLAVLRGRELADVPLLRHHLLRPPRSHVQLVNLADLPHPAAVSHLVLGPQLGEGVVVQVFHVLAKEDGFRFGRVVVPGDAADLPRHRLRVAAGRVDPPHLRGAVERGFRLRRSLAVAEEVDRLAVTAPLRVPVVRPVEREAGRLALTACRDDPQVGLAAVVGLVPGAEAVGDVLAVRRHCDLGDGVQGEVVVRHDVMPQRRLLGERQRRQGEEQSDEQAAHKYLGKVRNADDADFSADEHGSKQD
jgi:hypothetical protein